MANELCLLNLDTGDFIKLGKLTESEDYGVPELGYEGSHALIGGLPLMYDEEKEGPHPDWLIQHRKHKGHALNTFLATSLGCRLILIRENQFGVLLDDAAREKCGLKDGVAMEIFGDLEVNEERSFLTDDEGNNTSPGSYFYKKRLSRDRWIDVPESLEEIEKKQRKQKHYIEEIKDALAKNIVQKLGADGKMRWVYSIGQKPISNSVKDEYYGD